MYAVSFSASAGSMAFLIEFIHLSTSVLLPDLGADFVRGRVLVMAVGSKASEAFSFCRLELGEISGSGAVRFCGEDSEVPDLVPAGPCEEVAWPSFRFAPSSSLILAWRAAILSVSDLLSSLCSCTTASVICLASGWTYW